MRFRALLLALPLLTLGACDTTDSDPEPEPGEPRVLVASQGNFGEGNGSLVVYRPDSASTEAAVSGLFIQSVAFHGAAAYLASTASVEAIGAGDYQSLRAYEPVPNPRYFAFDGQTAWVTNLYTDATTFGAGGVTRLDLASGAVADTAIVGGNPDGIALFGDRLYVANYDYGASRTLTVLNPTTLDETARLDIGCDGPRMLFVDEQDELLAVCETSGEVVILDAATGTVEGRLDLGASVGTAGGGQVADYSATAELLHVLDSATGTVYRVDTATNALAGQFTVGGSGLNAVGYDARDGRLYLGQADPDSPYTAPGFVSIHDATGVEVGRFGAGVLPTHVAIAD